MCAQQISENEQAAATASGQTLTVLMERAGAAVFARLQTRLPAPAHVGVLAGKGNNGGDALVVARLAREAGYRVSLYLPAHPQSMSEARQHAWQRWQQSGQPESVPLAALEDCDLLVDGLLGSGFTPPLRNDMQQWIERINAWHKPLIAIDVPSGVCADLTDTQHTAVMAYECVSFIAHKIANLSGPTTNFRRHLHLDTLGLDRVFTHYAGKPIAITYCYADLPPLPQRRAAMHKGAAGKLLCVGSSKSMPGAIRLCAQAALRSGSGYVKVMCDPRHHHTLSSVAPELLLGDFTDLDEISWCNSLAIGPGLGQTETAQQVFKAAVSYACKHDLPTVIDADGLNLLASDALSLPRDCVLTPHPGEAARLLNCPVSDIEQDRLGAATALATKFKSTVVLKGAGSLVVTPTGAFICRDGNPGMASAGMGDTLTGIIAGLLAQRLSASSAALFAVAAHAHCADRITQLHGERGILASDIVNSIQAVINHAN